MQLRAPVFLDAFILATRVALLLKFCHLPTFVLFLRVIRSVITSDSIFRQTVLEEEFKVVKLYVILEEREKVSFERNRGNPKYDFHLMKMHELRMITKFLKVV